jgi:hypothetical protein
MKSILWYCLLPASKELTHITGSNEYRPSIGIVYKQGAHVSPATGGIGEAINKQGLRKLPAVHCKRECHRCFSLSAFLFRM